MEAIAGGAVEGVSAGITTVGADVLARKGASGGGGGVYVGVAVVGRSECASVGIVVGTAGLVLKLYQS